MNTCRTDPQLEQGSPSPPEIITAGRFALLLGLLILAAFPGVTLGWESFVFRDFGYYGYPLAHHLKESLGRGELPLWNPLNNFGIPFLAQWSTLALYPPSLLFILLPLPWSLNVFALAHLWLGGLGMFLLARRWTGCAPGAAVAGVAFAFNGVALNGLIWPHLTAALGWMPWVVLMVEQAWRKGGRTVPLAALVGALQMLTGGPEYVLATWGVLGILLAGDWLAGRVSGDGSLEGGALRAVARFGSVVLLVIALAAAQLLPFLELASHSHRSTQFATGSWSMPAWGWANFFVPLFHCEPSPQKVAFQPGQLWTSSYYLGLGVLALAWAASVLVRERRVWILSAAALFSVVFALGDHGPLYGLIREALPGVGFLRYPVKAVILTTLAVPLLAAFGLAVLTGPGAGAKGRVGWAIVALLVVLTLGVLGFAATQPGLEMVWPATRTNGLIRLVLLALTAGLVVQVASVRSGPARAAAVLGLVLVLWVDVLTHAPWQNPTVAPSALAAGLKPIDPMPRAGESRAMISPEANIAIYQQAMSDVYTNFLCNRLALSCNTSLLDDLPVVDGFYSLYLRPSREIHLLLYTEAKARFPALMDFLGVTRLTAPGRLFDFETRPGAMPWVTAGQEVRFADDAASLAGVQSKDWDPRRRVFLPEAARAEVGARAAVAAHAELRSFGAHRVEFEVENEGATVAVVAQAWYPAWRARVDGAEARVWRANHAFQAVAVPAGRHRVEFRYEDRPFRLGRAVSFLALAGCVVWLAVTGKVRRPSA